MWPMSRSSAELGIGPPAAEMVPGTDQIASLVVHDGAIDREALIRYAAAASGGAEDAVARAVAAEMA